MSTRNVFPFVARLRLAVEAAVAVLRSTCQSLRRHWAERAALRRFRRGLDTFIRPTRVLSQNTLRALQEPETTVETLRTAARSTARDRFRTEDDVLLFLKGIVDVIPERFDSRAEPALLERLAAARKSLECTTEGASLLALYDEAAAYGPMSPFLFVILDPNSDELTLDLAALGAQLALGKLRNEARALKLIHAVPLVLERVYGRHLRMLLALSYLAQREWPKAPDPRFGVLLDAVRGRTKKYPGLVEPLASRIRNAVAHTSWKYNPVHRTIRFDSQRDSVRAATEAKQVTLTLDEFEARLQRIWNSTMTVAPQLRAIAQDDMMIRSGYHLALPLLRTAFRTGDFSGVAQKFNDEAFERWMFRVPPPDDLDLWFLTPHDSSCPDGADRSDTVA